MKNQHRRAAPLFRMRLLVARKESSVDEALAAAGRLTHP
eukprot:CAMPEP_0119383584 /NCGR_PEP_ID=MMETSP1334-20130426/80572_1 /TAXON_ID=127549 /ORGANISM="Calcidiscus leptoporus, Strain RCC1130" /LENGTH=38 /DNA_ID= /DNA_START= /DNA_END= /DNA_ORIENTATION=